MPVMGGDGGDGFAGTAAAHGLDAVAFRPYGEALLAEEALASGGGAPGDAREPSPNAAAGLLLGRSQSNKYAGFDSEDDDVADSEGEGDDDLLQGLPAGIDPTRCMEGGGRGGGDAAGGGSAGVHTGNSVSGGDGGGGSTARTFIARPPARQCLLFGGSVRGAVDHDEEVTIP